MVEPGEAVPFGGLRLRSAAYAHSLRKLALRVECNGGGPSVLQRRLRRHDGICGARAGGPACGARSASPSIATCRATPLSPIWSPEIERQPPVRLGLVHVSRRFRAEVAARAAALAAGGAPLSVPEPGDAWEL